MTPEVAMKLVAARAVSVRAMTENLPSPCVAVCEMDALGQYCQGCLRSLDEIRLWSKASDAEKKIVWSQIEQRMASLRADSGCTTP